MSNGYANTPEKEALRAKRISESRKGMKFTKAHREAIRRARIGTKASPQAIANLKKAHSKLACDPAWRKRVSEGTRKRMRLPHVRRKHLAGLKRARAKHGVNFKGGMNQEPVGYVMSLWKLLRPVGYVREFPVSMEPLHLGSGYHYTLDFALVENKIAIECDGPKHRSFDQKEKDRIRDHRLKLLGWKVIRVLHD